MKSPLPRRQIASSPEVAPVAQSCFRTGIRCVSTGSDEPIYSDEGGRMETLDQTHACSPPLRVDLSHHSSLSRTTEHCLPSNECSRSCEGDISFAGSRDSLAQAIGGGLRRGAG